MRTALLTPRRLQVIQGLMEGKANKIIAYDLGLEQSTVKVHVRNLMQIYRVPSRSGLVAHILQKRLDIARAALESLDCEEARRALAEMDRV